MTDVYTASTVIEAAPDRVFEFASKPEHQPKWAVNFVRSTRALGDGRHLMETPFGEMTYRVDADPGRRVIDFVFESPQGESILPARVVPHSRGSIFTLTLTRAPGAPPEGWEQGKRGLDEELGKLKELLERG